MRRMKVCYIVRDRGACVIPRLVLLVGDYIFLLRMNWATVYQADEYVCQCLSFYFV